MQRQYDKEIKQLTQKGMNIDSIAAFCGVKPVTVSGWARAKYVPTGFTAVKLFTLFRLAGIVSDIIPKLPKLINDIADLIAFGIVTSGEVMEIGEFPASQHLIRPLLHSNRSVSGERAGAFEALVREKQDKLVKKRGELTSRFGTSAVPVSASVAESVSTEAAPDPEEVMETFRYAVEIASVMGKIANSDRFTAEQRATLRARFPGDGLNKFSDLVKCLLSEESRKRHQQS